MKVVCAWCGATISEGSEPVTHGICPRCAETFDLDSSHSTSSATTNERKEEVPE